MLAPLSSSTWRWENVPLPEPHLAALGISALAHLVVPARLPIGQRTSRLVGWPLMAGAVALAAWAVRSASAEEVAVDRPARLVTTGAYAVTRNPMYLAWSLALAGLAVSSRSVWLLVGAAMATVAVHRDVIAEERALSRAFGAEYDTYRAATPRYLPRVPIKRR